MKTMGQEEKRLAIKQRDFHQDIPAVMVIEDGGWSKRTHKHSYNAKSSTANYYWQRNWEDSINWCQE